MKGFDTKIVGSEQTSRFPAFNGVKVYDYDIMMTELQYSAPSIIRHSWDQDLFR